MADDKKLAVAEPETKDQAGECCEPVCGPTTCEPGTEAAAAKVESKVVEEPKRASSGCGPSTCG